MNPQPSRTVDAEMALARVALRMRQTDPATLAALVDALKALDGCILNELVSSPAESLAMSQGRARHSRTILNVLEGFQQMIEQQEKRTREQHARQNPHA